MIYSLYWLRVEMPRAVITKEEIFYRPKSECTSFGGKESSLFCPMIVDEAIRGVVRWYAKAVCLCVPLLVLQVL